MDVIGPDKEKVTGGGEDCTDISFTIYGLFFTKFYLRDHINENAMCGTYITHGENEKCIQNFGRKT
jgi:hypothetical protein